MNTETNDENPAVSAGGMYLSYRHFAAALKGFPIITSAPSFVIPGTVSENCSFLNAIFPDMALCLFETTSCLAYGDADLPHDPAALSLTFHAHLPMDLPWAEGPQAAARAALGVADAVRRLSPRLFVLHPPETIAELVAFTRIWTDAGHTPDTLLLENIGSNDLRSLLPAVADLGLGVCLDLGHMMAYEQHFLMDSVDWTRVHMLHVNAPQPGGSKHLPLDQLDEEGRTLLRRMLARLAPGATVTLEIFEECGLMRSTELFIEWMHLWNLA